MDETQNIYKQAGQILRLESERWTDIGIPAAAELRGVSVKLTQLGYLDPKTRRRILRDIDDAEQAL